MNTITLVGMIAGILLIVTAIAIFWSKKEFPAGGVAVTVIGLVLIVSSQWSSFKLKVAGVELDAVQKQLNETIAAAAEVAAEAHNAAAGADATRQQVAILTTQLAERNFVTPEAAATIQRVLKAAPHADTTRLRSATVHLEALRRPMVHTLPQ